MYTKEEIGKMIGDEPKKKIIKIISELGFKEGKAVSFHDSVKLLAISLNNAITKNEVLEDEYIRLSKKYSDKELENIAIIGALLVKTMEVRNRDILGELYMEMQLGNEDGGQFFSPYQISEIVANLVDVKKLKSKNKIYLKEPTCGSGSMIIAYANNLKRHGINFQEKLYVEAEDIDIKAVYMTYLQISMLGIKGIIRHREILNNETWLELKTPMLQMEEQQRL